MKSTRRKPYVCREDNLGDISDRWLHNVYFIIVLYPIGDDSFRKDPLLQKTLQNKKSRIYDKNRKSLKKW